MVDAASVTDPGAPVDRATGGASSGAAAWVRQHRPVAIGAAGVILLGLVAHFRKGAASSGAAPAASVAAGTGTPNAYAVPASSYDSTANDVYNAIEPQIEALARSMAGASNPTVPAPDGTPTAVTSPTTGGTTPTPASGTTGGSYQDALQAALANMSSNVSVPGAPAKSNPIVVAPSAQTPVASGGLVQGVIAFLAGRGVKAQSTAPATGTTGWEGWLPNLYIYSPRPTAGTPDPLAAYRSALATITNPYSSASSKQSAASSIGYTGPLT